MVKISSDFAPPLRIVAPFFLFGVLFYALSTLGLMGLNADVSWLDLRWVGWVHGYLIGFVMMIIVGAMAQLLPVVLEKGHCCIGFYPIVLTFTVSGTIMLLAGFMAAPKILPFGGLILVLGFGIFTIELLLTGKRKLVRNLSTKAMGFAGVFLSAGTIVGWIMSLGLSGIVDNDPTALIDLHAFTLLGGAILLIVIGIAQILLPMFGLAHGFSDRASRIAFGLSLIGIFAYWFGEIFAVFPVQMGGMAMLLAAVSAHMVQVVWIDRKKVRKEIDIWYRSLIVAYLSLLLSLIGVAVALSGHEQGWIVAGWLFGTGFLGFLITGHLYKIIPFLVWFERFSPLVGKQKVPMLHQMVPRRAADFQWGYSTVGVLTAGLALILQNDDLWHGGIAFLFVGSVFMIRNVVWMIRFKN